MIKFLVVLILMIHLFSCSKKTEVIVQGDPDSSTTGNQMGGTDSVGGGNGVAGKPLESYHVDLKTTELFKEKIQILGNLLLANYQDFGLDFYHIIYNRDWYFVPIKLDQIPQKTIGSFAKTDQMALQDLNKVWIDQNIFSEMTSQDQYVLAVHEIVMGIKLLAFKNKNDLCKASALKLLLIDKNDSLYRSSVRNCNKTYPYVVGEDNLEFRLSKEDYDHIRSIVIQLTSEVPDIDKVKELVDYYEFRKY